MTTWSSLPAELVTARLVLGPWRDDDLEPFTTMVGERDPRTASAPPPGGFPADELRRRIDRRRVELAETGLALLALRVDGLFAGYCGLTAGHASADEPEIAYELLTRFHGHGYATEAAAAVVDAARDTGRARLWASVRPWNAASFGVLTRVGFVATGQTVVDEAGAMAWWTCDLTVR